MEQQNNFEEKINAFLRKGDLDKAKLLQSLNKRIMPKQVQRILRNDKTVLQEVVLPNWVSWELLQQWAFEVAMPEQGKFCTLCNEKKEIGVKFKDKFICESCFKEIKSSTGNIPEQ